MNPKLARGMAGFYLATLCKCMRFRIARFEEKGRDNKRKRRERREEYGWRERMGRGKKKKKRER